MIEASPGRLGTFIFPAGCYIYTGSAKRALARRIGRHRDGAPPGRFHWHIDYLSGLGQEKAFAVVRDPGAKECAMNEAVGSLAGSYLPAPGFGSSDCRCRSHLWFVGSARWPSFPGLEPWTG